MDGIAQQRHVRAEPGFDRGGGHELELLHRLGIRRGHQSAQIRMPAAHSPLNQVAQWLAVGMLATWRREAALRDESPHHIVSLLGFSQFLLRETDSLQMLAQPSGKRLRMLPPTEDRGEEEMLA